MDNIIWWNNFCGNKTPYDAFWHPQVSWNTSNPDLTLCFQNTVMVWVPTLILLISGAIAGAMYCNSLALNNWHDKSRLNKAKLLLVLVLWLCEVMRLLYYCPKYIDGALPIAFMLATIVNLFAFVFDGWLFHMEHKTGNHTSGVQQGYWTLKLITAIIFLRSSVMNPEEERDKLVAATMYLSLFCTLILCLLVFFSDKSALLYQPSTHAYYPIDEKVPLLIANMNKPGDTKTDIPAPPPESYCSFIISFTYQWFLCIALKGWRRTLTFEDLPDLLERDKADTLLSSFQREWNSEKRKTRAKNSNPRLPLNKHKKPSLVKALLWTTIGSVVKFNAVRLVDLVFMFMSPILLRQLLNYIKSEDPYTWKGVLIAFAMCFSTLVQNLMIERFLYYGYNCGMNLRTVTTAMVYRKILRLSNTARRNTTSGEILNLMSVDSQKLENLPPATSVLWFLPTITVISTVLLWQTVGPSCMAGVLLLALIIPTNGVYIANKIRKLQRIQMLEKDKRLRTIAEMFSGIKILKLYSWERPFEKKVLGFRKEEMKTIKNTNVLTAVSNVAWNNATYMVTCAIFVTYILSSSEHMLDPDKVFVTFALVNMLSFPLHLMPTAVNNASQAIISIQRIQKFLLMEEIDNENIVQDRFMDDAITVQDATFSWHDEEFPTLRDISLDVKSGELVAVIGQVGAGKTSLISALLGEMTKRHGYVSLKESVAYVPQQAWIRNSTVRNNIQFNSEENKRKYQEVIRACALTADLQILTDGDLTEIGEKGVNLSGGQKQRISLARAVYQDCGTYLLDDPLSAVDAHVAKHLFDNVVGPKGLLRHKTRILVTHSITFLSQVDTIVLIKNGQISEKGSFKQLLNKGGAFAEFLRTYQTIKADYSSAVESSSSYPKASPSGTDQPRRMRRRRRTKSSGEYRSVGSYSQYGSAGSHELSELSGNSGVFSKSSTVPEEVGKLIKDEGQESGTVNLSVILDYIKAGGWFRWLLTLLFHLAFLITLISGQIWLSQWSNDINRLNYTQAKDLQMDRVAVYTGFIASQVILIMIGSMALAFATTLASQVYHSRLIQRLLLAPMRFFDVTPLGRILNRCSRDVDYLDANIPLMIGSWLYTINPVIATLFIVSYSTPLILVIIFPIGIAYVVLQRFFITTGRQLRRIDSVKRSPIFAHFDESIPGAVSIRAYRREDEFVQRCDRLIDDSQRALYHDRASKRWLETTMVFLGSAVVFCTTLFSVLKREEIGEGLAGLSVSFALQFTLYTNFFVRAQSELDSYMVAAERVKEYTGIETEADYERDDFKPFEGWPEKGIVSYVDYGARYRPGLDLALKNMSFDTNPAEKIGIVGRTGAGKSSMALSLFRIIEAAEGQIVIDGINIADLGLHDLRSKLTIIPQDPVVFSGTLRFNIDPLMVKSDSDIWRSLTLAHLDQVVRSLPGGLSYECGENGENLSVGQRQLICLARAALRKSKILVLDEATSSVDLETDDLIQTTIRQAFINCTVITIAHRINTILDYDRVIVMDKGSIKEIGAPTELLDDRNSMFYSMAKNAGIL